MSSTTVHIQVQQAVVSSWRAIDCTDGARAHRHYISDGVFITPTVTLSGHEELKAGHLARHSNGVRISRHLIANLLITGGDREAVADYTVTLYSGMGEAPQVLTGVKAVVDVRDEFVAAEGEWLIKTRTLAPVFISEDNDSIMLGRAE